MKPRKLRLGDEMPSTAQPCACLSIFIYHLEPVVEEIRPSWEQWWECSRLWAHRILPISFLKVWDFCVPQHGRTYVTCMRNRLGEQNISISKGRTKLLARSSRSVRGSGGTWNSSRSSTSISRQLSIIGTPKQTLHGFRTCFSPQLMVSLAAVPGWERSTGSFPPQITLQGSITPKTHSREFRSHQESVYGPHSSLELKPAPSPAPTAGSVPAT